MPDSFFYASIIFSLAGGFAYSVMMIFAVMSGLFNACKIWLNGDE